MISAGTPCKKAMRLCGRISHGRQHTAVDGFTLIEAMITTAVVGLLLALAIPTYNGVIEGLKVKQAGRDLMVIANEVTRYRTAHDFRLPNSLDELPSVPRLDPWKNAYEYLNFASGEPGINGRIRKDHNLHPLNSEFDLYSKGPDGQSRSPLTAAASRDDVLWARDGNFVGKASDF
jgi:general secretion pathway protein G